MPASLAALFATALRAVTGALRRAPPPYRKAVLERRAVLRLAPGRGLRLDCLQGCAWVTIDGQLRDIVLERGQSLVLYRHAEVFVSAMPEATVGIARR